jgi:hypothetical protein
MITTGVVLCVLMSSCIPSNSHYVSILLLFLLVVATCATKEAIDACLKRYSVHSHTRAFCIAKTGSYHARMQHNDSYYHFICFSLDSEHEHPRWHATPEALGNHVTVL